MVNFHHCHNQKCHPSQQVRPSLQQAMLPNFFYPEESKSLLLQTHPVIILIDFADSFYSNHSPSYIHHDRVFVSYGYDIDGFVLIHLPILQFIRMRLTIQIWPSSPNWVSLAFLKPGLDIATLEQETLE